MSGAAEQLAVVDPDREQYLVRQEPYYRTVADEVDNYEAAYRVRMPVMLKGPTGCGKSRFVEYMAWKLEKPLISVAWSAGICSTSTAPAGRTGR